MKGKIIRPVDRMLHLRVTGYRELPASSARRDDRANPTMRYESESGLRIDIKFPYIHARSYKRIWSGERGEEFRYVMTVFLDWNEEGMPAR